MITMIIVRLRRGAEIRGGELANYRWLLFRRWNKQPVKDKRAPMKHQVSFPHVSQGAAGQLAVRSVVWVKLRRSQTAVLARTARACVCWGLSLSLSMPCRAVPCHAMPCHVSPIQRDTMQYTTMQYTLVQYKAIQCNTPQCNTPQCNTIRYNTIQYNTRQYRAG